ncbi:MAG TPA: ParB/RepB/Spo0J family partition protein [Burkholderiaceae bacterium]|jgi:ParB family chromosome partitioning protein|nr:ParB/RepB/Spo0J family partition protein [Burkholderiaceae bacterium]
MSKPRPKGLGRGLEALLGGHDDKRAPRQGEEITVLAVADLQPGRYQPRTRMDESSLQDLAASIRTYGVMAPIVVRPVGGGRWEIIAGERRYRAAQIAGLSEVPVVVREVPDEQALAMALIENIQREDLNPLEQAQAIRKLIDEFGYSHERAADAVGRSRSATSNLLRLLNLAEPVQTMLLAGDLDMGHARALLAVDRASQIMLGNRIVQKRLSVREAEKLVARQLQELEGAAAGRRAGSRRVPAADRDLLRTQERLSDLLGTTVALKMSSRGKGRIVIDFSDLEQFDGLLQRMRLSLQDD